MTSSTPESATDSSITERVLEAVARREGVDALDLDERLYDVIDPDALDALFGHGASVSIEFTYLGYAVSVNENGEVTVRE